MRPDESRLARSSALTRNRPSALFLRSTKKSSRPIEGFYLSDPESGKLKLVDYADYVSGHVRRLFANASELRERWRSPDDRRQIEELFSARGISFPELAERVGHPESDPLDLLVFVA